MKIEAKILNKSLLNYDDVVFKGTSGSAAIDLRAMISSNLTIFPKSTIKVQTGLSVWIQDPGYAGLIMARSGTATKKGLAPANKVGLIDSDYQGELIIALHNHSSRTQEIMPGERIAQLIIVPIAKNLQLELVDEYSNITQRGSGGFGSTGAH